MESIPRKPLRAAYHCSLASGSDVFAWHGRCSSDAVAIGAISRSLARGYARYQGRPHSNKVSACSQAAGRELSLNPGEYLLYCTSDEKLWTSWRVQPATRTVRGPGRLFQGIALPDGY